MPEAIISASGVQHGLIVNPDGSINTAISGGITIGSVSAHVDSIYIQSGANMVGSAYVYQKTDPWAVSGIVSVTPSGTFNVTTTVDVGSESYIKGGSVQPYGQLGSVEIWQKTAADLVISVDSPEAVGSLAVQTVDGTVTVTGIATAGSLAIQTVDGTITANQGTDPWGVSGIVSVTPSGVFDVIISGGISIGSVTGTFTTGSESYNFVDSGGAWIKETEFKDVIISGTPGVTATINSPATIGSYTTQTVDGTVTVTGIATAGSLAVQAVSGIVTANVDSYLGSEAFIPAGSVVVTSAPTTTVTATNLDIRDLTSASDSVEVIGSVNIDNAGDVGGYAGSDTTIVAGSVQPYSQLGSVEVWQTTAADMKVSVDSPAAIGSYTTQTIDGTVTVTGIATAGSLAVQEVIGSVNIDNADDVGGYAGSDVTIVAGSVQPYGQLGSVEIWQKTAADLTVSVDSPAAIGSYTTQTVDGTVNVTGIATAGSLATQTVDGTVTVTGITTAGSLAVQTVAGSVGVHNIIGVTPSGTFNVTASATNLDIRDLTSASDSVEIIGSVNIDNASDVGGYTGSDVTIVAGSIQPYAQLGSVEIWQKTAADMVVSVDSPASIGSYTTQTVDGTVTVTGIATAGSLAIQDVDVTSPEAVGSLAVQTVDGTVTVTGITTAGSLAIQAVSGIVTADINSPEAVGSLAVQTVDATNLDIRDLSSASDSVTATISSPATIGSYTTQTVDGTVTVTGIATAGSLATQTVDGTVTVTGIATAGSLAVQDVAGSVNVIGEIVLEDVGSPCFKEATAIASGTYIEAWEVLGTGSKLEVHGWKVSTNLPGDVRILRSGGTLAEISNYHLNYASGATIEKTFVTPIIPGGADIHMGFGTTVAGSTAVTIYGREVK